MVVDSAEVDRIFHALADATRRDILARVMHAEESVSSLARRYPMSFAAVQKHVAVLEQAALVVKVRRGREQLVHGNATTVQTASQLLERYADSWRERLQKIDEIL
jgi:DNA-binding transcriptional ArsR family regulator